MVKRKAFFLDTYALIEIINGKKSYKPYIKDIQIITTKFNLLELHYCLLKEYGEKKANMYYDLFQEFCIEITDDDFKQASKFRYTNISKSMSYVDVVGYTVSLLRGIKFLTGDKEFKDLQNVEFVK